MLTQTSTHFRFSNPQVKSTLLDQFVGQSLDAVRTPAMVIDRSVFAHNCALMHQNAIQWGAKFRAHLKTHKTAEGTKLQLVSSSGRTDAVVVSTLMEAWQVVESGLVADKVVSDILYGLPVAPNKVADLASLRERVMIHGGVVRLLVDHQDQIRHLEEFAENNTSSLPWSVFVKIDGGQRRAGVVSSSPAFTAVLDALFSSQAVSLYGFYAHAGNSYASSSPSEASTFFSDEVKTVDDAAALALSIMEERKITRPAVPFVLSIGSTPTANAAGVTPTLDARGALHGVLELHAGNYPMLGLQQKHTGLITNKSIAQRVRATVISYYPERGAGGTDEALIDAGAIAFSKDSGPSGHYGEVIGTEWRLGRISQEHGILTRSTPVPVSEQLKIGHVIEIIGQHACLIAAAHPWYYIVDAEVEDGKKIVDVWVPWKGW